MTIDFPKAFDTTDTGTFDVLIDVFKNYTVYIADPDYVALINEIKTQFIIFSRKSLDKSSLTSRYNYDLWASI